MDGKRIFVAIEISEEARSQVSSYVASLRREYLNLQVRWEPPEKYHITVKFAGQTDGEQLNALTELVEARALRQTNFNIAINGTGSFINSRGPKVLWLGLEVDPVSADINPLETWVHDLSESTDKRAAKTRRRFNPHLTIARLKDANASKELIEKHLGSDFARVEFEAKEMVIYESLLLPTGSVYLVVSRHPFRGLHEE